MSVRTLCHSMAVYCTTRVDFASLCCVFMHCQIISFLLPITGETGLGKSTLMDTLFNTEFEAEAAPHDLPGVKVSSSTYGKKSYQTI